MVFSTRQPKIRVIRGLLYIVSGIFRSFFKHFAKSVVNFFLFCIGHPFQLFKQLHTCMERIVARLRCRIVSQYFQSINSTQRTEQHFSNTHSRDGSFGPSISKHYFQMIPIWTIGTCLDATHATFFLNLKEQNPALKQQNFAFSKN